MLKDGIDFARGQSFPYLPSLSKEKNGSGCVSLSSLSGSESMNNDCDSRRRDDLKIYIGSESSNEKQVERFPVTDSSQMSKY